MAGADSEREGPGRKLFDYRLEHILSYTATLSVPEVIGPVAEGLRLNVSVTGGTVTGPKVRGIVRPQGGDWLTIRTDGVAVLDVRGTIETEDGALIFVSYAGTMDLGEGAYERILRQEPQPRFSRMVSSPRFQTAHPAYAWLNRVHALGIGEGDWERREATYDVYAVMS